MKNLPERAAQSIRERKLFRRGERMLVAVSGGLDSMVLLHLLDGLAAEFGWELFVAHFNHQLRGRASDADEKFVRQTAAARGLRFEADRKDVKAFAKRRGISIEMAAREMRHQFLAQTARRLKCPIIAVAHHADDQVELFFLRLLRGAGGAGLGGMEWSSISPVSKLVRIVRPLLDVTKQELEQYARENRIRFREDASNASRDVLRNRVRHELLPLLRKKFQPGLNRTVLRVMAVVGAEAETVSRAAQAWLAKPLRGRAFAKLPVGLQRQVVQLQLHQLKIPADFDLIESLRLQPGRSIAVNPHESVVTDKSGQVARVIPASYVFMEGRRKISLVRHKPPAVFAGLKLEWSFATGANLTRPRKGTQGESFDAGKIGRNVVLRHWQPGDRFQPIGMKSPVKLQDWFTNQKIPAARRRELVVATTERGEIFWVEGLRMGERFKLEPETRRQLRWCWHRLRCGKSPALRGSAPRARFPALKHHG